MGTIPNTESVYPTELCWQTGNFTDKLNILTIL